LRSAAKMLAELDFVHSSQPSGPTSKWNSSSLLSENSTSAAAS